MAPVCNSPSGHNIDLARPGLGCTQISLDLEFCVRGERKYINSTLYIFNVSVSDIFFLRIPKPCPPLHYMNNKYFSYKLCSFQQHFHSFLLFMQVLPKLCLKKPNPPPCPPALFPHRSHTSCLHNTMHYTE